MAAIYTHFFPTLPPSPSSRVRISSLSASSPSSLMQPRDGGRPLFTEFPYVLAPHRDLMVDLVSSIETRLGSSLLPSNLPPEAQFYRNQNDAAHASFRIRSGVPSSQIDFVLGSFLHCELPSGGALNITTLFAYLNSLTDAPNFVVELIQSSPTSMVLVLDLPPRKDLLLDSDYLKTFYEDTQLDQYRQRLEKLPEVKPYVSPSLYIRCSCSPTAIMVRIDTTEAGKADQMEEIVRGHVSPIAKEVLELWLDLCACRGREVGESDRAYLENRDKVTKSKSIDIDLGSTLPRLFGQEVANQILENLGKVYFK